MRRVVVPDRALRKSSAAFPAAGAMTERRPV